MNPIRLTGRKSNLSLRQIALVKQAILKEYPTVNISIEPMDSFGDLLTEAPLQTYKGSDFFTETVFNTLTEGKADMAVHSLKDMSGHHLFSHPAFAIVDRNDPRDIAIFNPDILEKIAQAGTIRIGTSSPRRSEMATDFLSKVLPAKTRVAVEAIPIRGNIEERLGKLKSGNYDGIILATAGINRLLSSKPDAENIKALLHGTLTMLLPIIECVAAPGQGALLAEANPGNKEMVALLEKINDEEAYADSLAEKKHALSYGSGCDLRFGMTTIYYDNRTKKAIYAAGTDKNGNPLQEWHGLAEKPAATLQLFSSANYMGDFQKSTPVADMDEIAESHVFVASKNAIASDGIIKQLKQKTVWAAGTHTWKALAKAGIWVSGCADGLGLEQMEQVWQMELLKIHRDDVVIITQQNGSEYWKKKGWKTLATYESENQSILHLKTELARCNLFFWTNASQYKQCIEMLPAGEIYHACPAGATANQLREAGLHPIVFPTIPAFKYWCQQHGV